jgi:hypothetical protein
MINIEPPNYICSKCRAQYIIEPQRKEVCTEKQSVKIEMPEQPRCLGCGSLLIPLVIITPATTNRQHLETKAVFNKSLF